MNSSSSKAVPKISLLVSDVDGTLVTKDKVLTERSRAAVQRLYDAGIRFAITSSRPAKGMSMFVEPLKLKEPMGAFNGGIFVKPDMSVISKKTLPRPVAAGIIEIIESYSLAAWVYIDNDWYVQDLKGPHVAREEFVIQTKPKQLGNFNDIAGEPAKIVGVSDQHDRVLECEKMVQEKFGAQASATKSQAYYLDITHPQANKGVVIDTLAQYSGIERSAIATIGDGGNDILMFGRSGVSIAMGNASAEVKKHATFVTDSNEEDGFANAIENIILGALVSS